jgi:hypothetical protein
LRLSALSFTSFLTGLAVPFFSFPFFALTLLALTFLSLARLLLTGSLLVRFLQAWLALA